jgi:hypothetical protein
LGKVYDRTGALVHGSVTFVDMGDGNYQVEVSDADKATGVIIVVDGSTGTEPETQFQIGVVSADGLLAVQVCNPDGSRYSGSGSCAFDTYRKPDGLGGYTAVTPPTLAHPALNGVAQRYLWIATLPAADVADGVSGTISTPADAIPSSFPFLATEGDFAPGTAPAISNIVPADGTPIAADQGLGFDITDPDGDLLRTHVYAYFPATKAFEVVYFDAPVSGYRSAGFAPRYSGTRVAISGGFRFSNVVRQGGWPSRVVLVTDPRDATGQESA